MSHREEISSKYGWPLKIHSRGYDAYPSGVQPLTGGDVAAIYRFPGGESVVFEDEMNPAEKFHELMSIVWATPSALDNQKELFEQQPVDWYKEIALHAMKSISHTLGPEQFTHKEQMCWGGKLTTSQRRSLRSRGCLTHTRTRSSWRQPGACSRGTSRDIRRRDHERGNAARTGLHFRLCE